MTANARSERWQQLLDAGLVDGEAGGDAASATPWYIGALLGVAAWLAAIFLLVFLGLLLEDLVREPLGAIACGLVVTAISVAVLRRSLEHAFVSQLAIAFSLAGQALVLAGLVIDGPGGTVRWFGFAAFEAGLIVVVAHAAHRVVATLAAAAALLMAASALGVEPLFLPLVLGAYVATMSRTLAASPHPRLWHALSIALALALVGAIALHEIASLLADRGPGARSPLALRWIATATIASLSAWAGVLLVEDATGEARSYAAAMAAAALAAFAIVALVVPGVAALAVMLLLAYAAGQRVVGGLATLGLLVALGHYYYRLDTMLLAKAAALLAIGLMLFVARAIVLRLVASGKEAADA